MSSRFASICQTRCRARRASSGASATTRSTFGRSARSMSPAPQPTASARAGRRGRPARHRRGEDRGAGRRAQLARRRRRRPSRRRPRAGPRARRAREPAARRARSVSVPCPIATLAQLTLAGESQSSAAAVPTTSTIESIAPTSWNVTSSIVVPCSLASARARRSKMSSARVARAVGERARAMRQRMSA